MTSELAIKHRANAYRNERRCAPCPGDRLAHVIRLFLPQATLEAWALDDKADLREGKLVVTGEQGEFSIAPAVHFVRLVSGEDDRALVSKVKTQDQLTELGAEHMMDSVLLGESAYEVVPGYVTEVAPPAPTGQEKRPKDTDADMLAAFLLDKI